GCLPRLGRLHWSWVESSRSARPQAALELQLKRTTTPFTEGQGGTPDAGIAGSRARVPSWVAKSNGACERPAQSGLREPPRTSTSRDTRFRVVECLSTPTSG